LIKNDEGSKKLKTIGKIFIGIIIAYFVISFVLIVGSWIVRLITPNPTSFPSVQTVVVKPNETLYVGPGGAYYITLDTSWSGIVKFSKQGYKHLKPTGAYLGWALKDWNEPRVAYPGMEKELWLNKSGLFPLEFKFRSVKGTILLFVEVDKN